jgi:ribonuclease R
VQVSRVDLDGRKIDFRLVLEGNHLPARTPRERDKGAAQPSMDGVGRRAAKRVGRTAGAPDRKPEPPPRGKKGVSVRQSAAKGGAKARKSRR